MFERTVLRQNAAIRGNSQDVRCNYARRKVVEGVRLEGRHPSAFVRKMRLVPGGLHGMVPRTRYPWRS